MKSSAFIAMLLTIVNKFKTVYMRGVFGAPVTESLIASKARQYPLWYTDKKQAQFRKLIGKQYFAFDCVCLIKAILWGWTGNPAHPHGGATYNSNGVPDSSADGLVTRLNDLSEDFSNIIPGEVVWLPGHVGVYIGDGKVVECTTAWNSNVQLTALWNKAKIEGLNGRIWRKHGKLPYIEYEKPAPPKVEHKPEVKPDPEVKAIQLLCNALCLKDKNGHVLDADGVPGPLTASAVEQLPVIRLGHEGAAVKIIQGIVGVRTDGEFGKITLEAVKKWQRAHGLPDDGVVGKLTWAKMAKL